jgi:hypothetical protein
MYVDAGLGMNVQSAVDRAGRLIEGVQRQARDFLAENADTEEPEPGAVWEKVSPALEKALAIYDRQELADTPESTWVPFRETKADCQKAIDEILDTVLAVLETCGAAGYRTRIRNLLTDNASSQARLASYREQILSAPSEESKTFVECLVVSSKQALRDSIADETDRIIKRNQEIENLKAGFREHLQHIGINVPPDTADSFLLPVEDDIVSIAAVISNIGGLTEQLRNLVDESKEAPSETRKYYGMFVLLVFAVDRLQTHFVKVVDERFLPKISGYEKEAARHIADAQAQISRGGPKEQLAPNIAANQRNIEACRLMVDVLQDHRRSILAENRKVQLIEAAAVNSYRTVCLSLNVADLIGYCQAAFRALRELRLPPLRPFQNRRLNEELQNLAEHVTAK